MSRCFPFPPPGYGRWDGSGADQSLIESIKLHNDKERVKKEKKEKKKREKEKSRDPKGLEHKHRSYKKRKHDELNQSCGKNAYNIDAKDYAAEQLEKSGLSEENGPPAFILNSYDSVSTEDCRKQQRLETHNIGHNNEGKASVIRIRLPSMTYGQKSVLGSKEDAVLPKTNHVKLPVVKHNDVEYHRPNDTKLPLLKPKQAHLHCSRDLKKIRDVETYSNDLNMLSVKHENAEIYRSRDQQVPLVKQKDASHDVKLPFVKSEDGGLHRTDDHKMPLVKEKDAEVAGHPNLMPPVPADEACGSGRFEIHSGSTSHASTHFKGGRRVRKFERKFRDLIISWKPPAMDHLESSDSGYDWLLGSRKPHSSVVVQAPDITCKAFSDASESAGGLQIGACYLPENDIYALPYVVPY